MSKTRMICTGTQAIKNKSKFAVAATLGTGLAVQSQCRLEEAPNEEPEPDAPVQVVLAYDDDSAFRTALNVYRAMVQRLDGHFEFRDSWWRFSAFANPAQLARAAHLAAVADTIFCCPGNQCELPPAVCDWIALWSAHRNHRDGALAALLPAATPNNASPSPVREFLEDVARANGLVFFSTEYAPHPPRKRLAHANEFVPPNGENWIVCRIETRPEVRHWGINE